ncbi:glycosyltransferase family 2 protein [Ornithinimicrobium sp. Y1847]|uniref:glycosyltransferase family 2 protein n=1 Tax=Ornithinimicrobium sp. Y1847 TaxID=3405419 RepID=UPI003B680FA2
MGVLTPRSSVAGARLGWLAEPAADARRLQALALRSRHDLVLDVLAERAGVSVPAVVLSEQLVGDADRAASWLPRDRARVPYLLALAASWAARGIATGSVPAPELKAAVALHQFVLGEHGTRAIPSVDQRHLVQAAFLAGRHDLVDDALARLDRLTDAVADGLRSDLANPVVGGPFARSHEEWLGLFGSRFRDRGITPPLVTERSRGMDDVEGPLFDGLHLPGLAGTADGPLVTVIVPAYRPDAGLLPSVRSILDQSHGNLEILVVDDCSGSDFHDLFAAVEGLDERVRLIRQERNGGSYLGRNTALTLARGEWVTTQDADDWSHPERIARQLAASAEHPEALATRSAAIRARPDLTRQWFGYSPERMNASSLMVRREVLEQLGGFDPLRKGADSELHERLHLLDGVVDVALPLAVTRLADGSLSRADFAFGRHSPERVLFRSSFRRWHASLAPAAAARDLTGLAAHREGQRPYPAPRRFVRDLPHAPSSRPTEYGVVVLCDLARGPSVETAAILASQAAPAVLGREDVIRAGEEQPDWHPELLDAARDGRLELLTDADEVHADVLIVDEPNLLALPALPLPTLTADRALIVAIPPSADEPIRDLEAAGALVREHLGRAPEWVARSPRDQQVWREDGWSLPLLTDALT